MNLYDLFNEEKVRLDPKCWTGKKIGNPKTKVKGGVRVNNCVPAESVAEEYELAGVGVAYDLGRRAYQERKTIEDNPYSATKEARKYDEWEKGLERGKHDANDARLFRSSVGEQGVAEGSFKQTPGQQQYSALHSQLQSLANSGQINTPDGKQKAEKMIDTIQQLVDTDPSCAGSTVPSKKIWLSEQGMTEGQLEANTPDPVVVVQDLKGKILDKINLSVAAQKYKLGQPQNIKNQLAHQNYTKIGNYTIVSPMSGQPQDQTTTGQKQAFTATEGEQQKGADYRDPKEVDYDDAYDSMVARVKKLAGLGPMKTVYDPAKRQYRNMPTAQQPKK